MMCTHRPLSSLLIISLATVVGLELVLQSISWMQHLRLQGDFQLQLEQQSAATERTVLCVGDSNTFGHGATSRENNYPSQLQVGLNAASTDSRWKVLNFGKPGSNSAHVVRHLSRWIHEVRPAYVFLLTGINDQWWPSNLTEFPPEDSSQGLSDGLLILEWNWTYRTGRFLRLLAHNIRAAKQQIQSTSSKTSIAIHHKEPLMPAFVQESTTWDEQAILDFAERALREKQDVEQVQQLLTALLEENQNYVQAKVLLVRSLVLRNWHERALVLLDSITDRGAPHRGIVR